MPITFEKIAPFMFSHIAKLKSTVNRWEIFEAQMNNLGDKLEEIGLGSQIKASFPATPVNILILGPGAGEEFALMYPYLSNRHKVSIDSITAVDQSTKYLESYRNCEGVQLIESDILEFLQNNTKKYDLILWGHPNIYSETDGLLLDYFKPSLDLLQKTVNKKGFVYIGCYTEREMAFVQQNNLFLDPQIKQTAEPKNKISWVKDGEKIIKTPHLFSAVSTPSCRKELEEKQTIKPEVSESEQKPISQPEELKPKADNSILAPRHRFMPPISTTRTNSNEEDPPKKAEGCCSRLFKRFGAG